jgi:SNF2 family DNA or RNA helicase
MKLRDDMIDEHGEEVVAKHWPIKPQLILVPSGMLSEWVKIAQSVSSRWNIVCYGSGSKILSKYGPELKHGQKGSNWTLILTSYETWCTRHRNTVHERQKAEAAHKKKKASKSNKKLPDSVTGDWDDSPFNFSQAFSVVWADEGHMLKTLARKNPAARSLAVSQLDPDFFVMVTGTPIKNEKNDLDSLMRFLVTQDAATKLIETRGWAKTAYEKETWNPFEQAGIEPEIAWIYGSKYGMKWALQEKHDGTYSFFQAIFEAVVPNLGANAIVEKIDLLAHRP